MKSELEEKDIEAIAEKVAEKLKAVLYGKGKDTAEDTIFDVPGLADYLKVDTSWVYKQVSFKAIPHFKNGKYTRFRKSTIDKWIDGQTINPLPPFKFPNDAKTKSS